MYEQTVHKVAFKTYHSDFSYFYFYVEFLKKQEGRWILIWAEYDIDHSYVVVRDDSKIQIIEYDFVVTSAVLTIKNLFEARILKN